MCPGPGHYHTIVVDLTLDIAHGEVDGKDDGQTDDSDDEDKNNQVSLKPENQDDDYKF